MSTSFIVNKADLEFILKQIKIAEATSLGYTPDVAPVSILQAIMNAYGLSASDATIAPYGLRTVDGTFNSLVPGHSTAGAADTLFPRLTDPVYRNDADGDSIDFDGPGPAPGTVQGNYGQNGNVVDADPRIISNLIVDMSLNNPAAITAFLNNPIAVAYYADKYGYEPTVANHPDLTNEDLQVIPNQSPDIGLSPGFNAWMTFFGQFFDHGLDLVTKANNGTVYIPLQNDDPLIAGADGILGTADDLPAEMRFMALTRAAPTMVDPDGAGPLPAVAQHENTTTSFVDQNQTYTSHSSHQVFLREYKKLDIDGASGNGPVAVSTGRLLDGTSASGSVGGAVGNWAEVKAQAIEMLGIKLSDFDVHNVPLLATDQYGKFLPSATGYAQVTVQVQVFSATGALLRAEGGPFLMSGVAGGLDLANLAVPSGLPALANGETYKVVSIGTGHAFLNDIAHHATPSVVDHDHNPMTPRVTQTADADIDANHNGIYDEGDTLTDVNNDGVINTADFFADDGISTTYDDEMLDSHFITGDGRGNENIALTTVHSIFHSEHNRLVEENKATIIASGDIAFLNEWLLVDKPATMTAAEVRALIPDELTWDGERLFQAARFGTEMQYQHLVFEEFARRMQPMVDPFTFNTSPDVNPAIVAEFAHTVYRFGHSMLTGTVDRLENDLTAINEGLNNNPDQKTLLAVFLNPQAYVGSGADLDTINANIIRGLSRDVGNAIDEFIVTDVRSNLLGLPLDLAALNIARGRETGIPSLNEARAQLYNDTGIADLKPYASWADFAMNIKNAASVVNFIAAYGTHASIMAAATLTDKRAAAEALVFGTGNTNGRLDFLNGTGAYASDLGGLNLVDLWIGGLAEKNPEFGGMLGTTFNYVFELQMESLQFGDRMYYLTRTQGTNFLNQLEPNTFSDLVMRNTALGDIYSTHINGALFTTPDHIIELDRGIAQEDYNGSANPGNDPLWDGSNPVMEALLGPKVIRGYAAGDVAGYAGNGDVSDNGHDEGGYLRVLGGEHYVLGGTEGNDIIYGDSGIDTLWGDAGDDYLNGMTESDDIFGGNGDDIIEDPFGDDVLRGNQGNDVITTARGADLVFGDQGSDYIVLGQDASEVFGGMDGDFILGGAGKDFLLGNEGDDWIEGAGGFDTLAGDNSELFFNSPIIGHDVMFGHGDETDYDAESGDDIMGSGPSVYRYEGMFGFDWGIAKNDISGVKFDLQIPIFTTIPEDVLRDRFDQVEALSGWKYGDILDGDDRGHSGGSSSPDSTPVDLFVDHTLDNAGIDRITGLRHLLGLDGVENASFKNGNVLIGGDGNDFIRGRGGFDIIDGDAWLNVRIKIVIPTGPNAGTYSAESMTTDTTVMGPNAGKVFHVYTAADQAANPIHIAGAPNFDSPAFGGVSLTSLLLNRTINPSHMSIVREILYDNTDVTGPNKNIDTAVFQGGDLEYEIEGTRIVYDQTTGEALRRVNIGQGDNSTQALNIRDVNGDGFITVRDLDDGTVAAPGRVGGLTVSRGALTDDTDKLVNIERLQFADRTLTVGASTNNLATGIVTISDPTPFDHDNNPATPGVVSPIVGQVLTAKLTNLVDADGFGPLDPVTGLPPGGTFEWQTTEAGNDGGWATISSGLTYTVRPVDPAHVLRAVAVFPDAKGVTERIASGQTDNVTAPFSVNENSPAGTVVAATIPFSLDYDPLGFGGTGVTDGDVVQLTHVISPGQDAGGRFTIVNAGTAQAPIYQLQVAKGGPVMLNYEAGVHTIDNQSHQFVDNQYQIVIDTYTDTIANGGVLMAQRQFTIFLNDVTGEVVDMVPTVDLHADQTTNTNTTFSENFNSTSYTQDDGGWTQDWVETGDDGSSTSDNGQIRIASTNNNDNELEFDNGSNAANSNGASIQRVVDLSGASSATLSYDYDESGFDIGDNETVLVQFAADGTNFTTLQTINGNSGVGSSGPIALTGPFSANSAIRFVVSAVNGNNDIVSIDNIVVTKTVTSTTPGAPGTSYVTTFTENGQAVAIASSPLVGNDHPSIMSARIRLTNAQAQDVLSLSGALPAGITSSFGPAVAGQITMYLTGNATLAAYQAAIMAVRFSNSSDNPVATPRTIEVTVNDGVNESTIATATVNVTAVNDAPSGTNDAIVTNSLLGTAFVIPEWALLANDIDPDGPAFDITAVSNAAGVTTTLATGSVSVIDTGAAGGSFSYTLSDGITTDATPPSVSVTTQNLASALDQFNSATYTGSDGVVGWASAWTEGGGETTSATNGDVQVSGGRLQFNSGVDGGETIQRSINLAGVTSATLTFNYEDDNLNGGQSVIVEALNTVTNAWQILTNGSFGGVLGSTTGNGNGIFTATLTGNLLGANSAIRFRTTGDGNNWDNGDNFYIDNVRIEYASASASIDAGAGNQILVGNASGTLLDGGTGNDTIFAGDGADTIVWNANANGDTDGRDFVDGGAGSDTFDVNTRAGTNESYRVYTVAAATVGANAIAGLTAADLKPGTEIIITRTTGGGAVTAASIIAELDNIEEIRIGTQTSDPTNGSAGAGDTVAIFGDFTTTSLALNTITIEGTDGDDTIDISALTSAHRIVFKSNGGHDTIVGTLRAQDVIELPNGATAADYETVTDTNGVTTMTKDGHSISFVREAEDDDDDVPPTEGEDDGEGQGEGDDDDDIPSGGNDDGDDDDEDAGGDETPVPAPTAAKTLIGTAAADVLAGAGGADTILGGGGADIVAGEGGSDILRGEDGDDVVMAGDGDDSVSGGNGDDQLHGGAGDDMLFGNAGKDMIHGDAGHDFIEGGAGEDQVWAGAGNDTVIAAASDGDDQYWGGDGNDTLDYSVATANLTVDLGNGVMQRGQVSGGTTGTDIVYGFENIVTGSGHDTITATTAVNIIDGGLGNDTFRFLSAAAVNGDTIHGFQPGDKIDFSAIDANTGSAGVQHFTLAAGGSLTAAGQVVVTHEVLNGDEFTVLHGNVDSNNEADFVLMLKGNYNLTASDFNGVS